MAIRKLKPNAPAGQPRQEILQIADVVAQEKGIDKEEVIISMEQALLKTACLKYGQDKDIQAVIDRSTGEVKIIHTLEVVEKVEDIETQIAVVDAKVSNPEVAIGDTVEDELPPLEFGRVAAHSARQVITQRVREAERARQYEEFKDRVGDIVNVLVKRVEFGNVIVDLGTADGVLRRDDLIPREMFRPGDRLRAIIKELRPDAKGPMILLSRTHPTFMAKLFGQEVPEVYEGVIEIKGVARDPGSRAKMAVYSTDHGLDPVGSCVGMRGSRVQAIVNELQGEKVDIILWSSNPATYVVNALAPAEVLRVVIDEDEQRISVVVPEDQLSLAIGRRGQNVRLASTITGWRLDVVTEEIDQKQRSESQKKSTDLFMEALDIDEIFAHLLVAEGFQKVEELTQITLSDFEEVEGVDEDLVEELKMRADNFLNNRDAVIKKECIKNGVEKELAELDIPASVLLKISEKGIVTRDNLGDLSGDELQDILNDRDINLEHANEIIMKARAHWFA